MSVNFYYNYLSLGLFEVIKNLKFGEEILILNLL